MKKLLTILALSLAALVASRADAQAAATRVTPCDAATPNNAICLVWTHDGKNMDGKAVTGVTYRVEQKFGSGAFTQVAGPLTAKQYYAQNRAPGTYVFMVFANCAEPGCVESNGSNQATRDATAIPSQPTAPVLVIAVLIREGQPPSYRVAASLTPDAGEYLVMVPTR